MVATTPTTEPTQFYKGDSVSWEKSLAHYPASEWALVYYLRGATVLDVTCTADGDTHVATISAAASDALTAGTYWWQAIATKDSDVKTVGNGKIEVLASLSDIATGTHDGRSHVKKVLDALEAVLENKATLDQTSYSIQGRSLSRMSPDEILKWYDRYKKLYADELRKEQLANGIQAKSSKIQVRFNT